MQKIIINGKVLGPQGLLPEGTAVLIRDGVIEECFFPPDNLTQFDQILDAQGLFVSPGFIDTHLHGALGHVFLEATDEAAAAIAKHLYSTGITGFLPTTTTLPKKDVLNGLAFLAGIKKSTPGMLGIHMEGPFINAERRGSQKGDYLQNPDLDYIKEALAASEGEIRIVTLAPELPGASELVGFLSEQDIVTSAGHTNANFNQFTTAYKKGLRHVTHMFNGMSGIHHRDLGVAGSAMLYEDVYCELIMDGIHVSPGAAQLLKRVKTISKIALITDSSRFTRLPNGEYSRFDGQKVKVYDNSVRVSSGSLAGSMLTMSEAVKNAVNFMGCTLIEAVSMATQAPAVMLGLKDKGAIESGKDADITIFDSDLNIKVTIINGKTVYKESDELINWGDRKGGD